MKQSDMNHNPPLYRFDPKDAVTKDGGWMPREFRSGSTMVGYLGNKGVANPHGGTRNDHVLLHIVEGSENPHPSGKDENKTTAILVPARDVTIAQVEYERNAAETERKKAETDAAYEGKLRARHATLDPIVTGQAMYSAGIDAGRSTETLIRALRDLAKRAEEAATFLEGATDKDEDDWRGVRLPKAEAVAFPATGTHALRWLNNDVRAVNEAMTDYAAHTAVYNVFAHAGGELRKLV